MKVILLEELPGKGGEGDVIDVARGYANNFLLTKGIAIKATEGNLKQLEQRRKSIAKREEVRIANAEALKATLEAGTITIGAKVGGEGQLFGSITSQMIVDAVKAAKDIELDRRRVDVREAIKTVGEHKVEVSLYREIKATLALDVVDADAPAQAAEEAVEEVVEAAEEAVEEVAEVAEETTEAVEDAVEEAAEAVEEAAE